MFGQNTKTYNKLSNEKHHKKTYHMGYFLKYLSHHRQIIFTQLIWNYAILPWNNISLLHKLETLFLDNTCHVTLKFKNLASIWCMFHFYIFTLMLQNLKSHKTMHNLHTLVEKQQTYLINMEKKSISFIYLYASKY
jgi:hypothetical protein